MSHIKIKSMLDAFKNPAVDGREEFFLFKSSESWTKAKTDKEKKP